MTPQTVMEIGRQALEMTLIVSAPIFACGSSRRPHHQHFQAATQINESTLSFIPKIVAMFITLIVAGPWMLQVMIDYIRRLFDSIPS